MRRHPSPPSGTLPALIGAVVFLGWLWTAQGAAMKDLVIVVLLAVIRR
ncbi:hypothetical protein [Sphaerisporangium fuscum]|nr:hypothetical protein [Sphaerisporangium fuscum]